MEQVVKQRIAHLLSESRDDSWQPAVLMMSGTQLQVLLTFFRHYYYFINNNLCPKGDIIIIKSCLFLDITSAHST